MHKYRAARPHPTTASSAINANRLKSFTSSPPTEVARGLHALPQN
jgi:hypothetical protein